MEWKASVTVLVLYLAALGPCEGENERNNCCACVRVGTRGLVGTRGPVDTPTNGKGAGEGGGSDKSNTVAVIAAQVQSTIIFIRMRQTLHVRESLLSPVPGTCSYFEVQIA